MEMTEQAKRDERYLIFTDWLDRVLKEEYKTDQFFNAAFEMLNAGEEYFELAATYTKSNGAYLYKKQ